MPGMQQAKYMVVLIVYIQGNFCVRKYIKKKEKRSKKFFCACERGRRFKKIPMPINKGILKENIS